MFRPHRFLEIGCFFTGLTGFARLKKWFYLVNPVKWPFNNNEIV